MGKSLIQNNQGQETASGGYVWNPGGGRAGSQPRLLRSWLVGWIDELIN